MPPQPRFKKFLFERSFDDPGKLYLPGERRKSEIEAEAVIKAAEEMSRQTAVIIEDAPVPQISPEEQLKAQLEAAREEGFVQGHTAALEEAETAREHYIADALNLIATGIDKLGEQQRAAYEQMTNEALRMVFAIIQKLLPPVAHHHAAETIGEFVRQVLPLTVSEPKLVVRAHSMITADLEARLPPLANRAGFRGAFAVEPDYELQPGDCRIEWDGGGSDRDEARIWRDIRAAIAATLGDIDTEKLDAAGQALEQERVQESQDGPPSAP